MNALQRTLCAVTVAALAAVGCGQTGSPSRTPALGLAPEATAGPRFTVKVLAFNDYHGNLESPGTFGQNSGIPAAQRPAVGGAEYLAAYVARYKALNPHNVVVGGGDFIGASPLVSALFYDEPSVETLNAIGVDFSSVGNHEFDKGPKELRRLQNGGCKPLGNGTDPNSCKGYGSTAPGGFDGARFKWLSANVIDNATGATLLPPYGIKAFNGVRVAFIGMTLQGTPSMVHPVGVAGLTFQNEAATVNALVPQLQALGVEAIVVLVHQGGYGSGNVDINGCAGDLAGSDIASIVAGLDDAVDLVISAHTHAAYNCSGTTVDNGTTPRATGLSNRLGRKIPVTSASAFGRVLTDIDMVIDPATRDVVSVSPTNHLVDRTDRAATAWVAAHPAVKNIVTRYKADSSPLAAQVIAGITSALPNSAASAGEMPAGDLIADAQLQSTQPTGLGGAGIAFMNPGGVRNPGFVNPAGTYPYALTYGDAFTVQAFGNSLVTMTLTAQQIKDALEQQFARCNTTQTANRILQVSNGLKVTWKASGTCGNHITHVSFTPTDVTLSPPVATGPTDKLVIDGVVQNPNKTYRVTVNSFMAVGGDGFTTFLGGRNLQGGAQDIDALVAYLSAFKAPAAAYDPASPTLNKPRISTVP
jgi:5'-nucleotidase